MAHDQPEPPTSGAIQQGLQISTYSLLWTITAGSAAIAIGIIGNTLTLSVFGIIGLLDAAGSATLVVHFRHALRHELISQSRERMTLRVVSFGMAAVGVATIADSAYRLHRHFQSSPLVSGIALSAVSVGALAILAAGKRRIARRIPSKALHADGWLSAVGALLAAVTVLGTTLGRVFAWWWIDPVAAIAVAFGAVVLSVVLSRGTGLSI